MGLRAGREHWAATGRAKSGSERTGGPSAAQAPHGTWRRAPSAVVWPPRGAQWMERERREARRGPAPCQAPGAESTEMRILGNRGRPKRRGKASVVVAVASGAGAGTAEVHAGRSRGGEGQESAPQSSWARSGWRARWVRWVGAAAPLGLVALAGWAGVGPSSLLLHAASLEPGAASGRAWSPVPRQPPARAGGLRVPSLPWGWG